MFISEAFGMLTPHDDFVDIVYTEKNLSARVIWQEKLLLKSMFFLFFFVRNFIGPRELAEDLLCFNIYLHLSTLNINFLFLELSINKMISHDLTNPQFASSIYYNINQNET